MYAVCKRLWSYIFNMNNFVQFLIYLMGECKMNTTNIVARDRNTITVVLQLTPEQSERAKELVTQAALLKQSELNNTFAGNVNGYRTRDFVAVYGTVWYKQGTLKYVGPRDSVGFFGNIVAQVIGDFFYWPYDAKEIPVITYGASDKKLKWYETFDDGYSRLMNEGKVTGQSLYNQAKLWTDVPIHYLKIITVWALSLPYMPKAGTAEYAQAAAGGTLDDFKYYDRVRAWVKAHRG